MLKGLRHFVVAVLLACSQQDGRQNDAQKTVHDTSGGAPPGGELITGTSIAGIRVCDPLDRVDSILPTARDTVAFGEDPEDGWPSKVVTFGPGEGLLFESSWIDTLHVWRISTTSSRFQTRSGLRVSSTIADVLATDDSLAFDYPEGILAISLTRDSVGFLIDDSSAAAFWRRFDYTGDPLNALPRTARIKLLGIGGDCRSPKAAA
jgi:hypothetical protein